MAEGQVRVRHILQKHNQSRNPFDRVRNVQVTRSKDEAIANINAFVGQIQSEDDFKRIARESSECGSSQQEGDLGFFGPGQMQAAFEQASFALQVGQVSGLVDSDSGIHIILRIAWNVLINQEKRITAFVRYAWKICSNCSKFPLNFIFQGTSWGFGVLGFWGFGVARNGFPERSLLKLADS